MKILVELLEQHPNPSRKEIRKAMDLPPPKHPKTTAPGAKNKP